MEKPFKGKAIYNPQGKAGEYAAWACNFYTGCANNCSYCYLKKGVLSHCWSDEPQLKKCFGKRSGSFNELHALEIFEDELVRNIDELQKHGLFFSFTTDPMIESTFRTTEKAVIIALKKGVPVKILTKSVVNICQLIQTIEFFKLDKNKIAIGFTLTGHDELEPNASPNLYRIEFMSYCKRRGIKTFASIEPIIDFKSSFDMIKQAAPCCDLFKIGLMSGAKVNKDELEDFVFKVWLFLHSNPPAKVYWKDSITKITDRYTKDIVVTVGRDYNLFDN